LDALQVDPKRWDFNLNFQVSDECSPVGPRDGPEAVVLLGHEVFEDVFASKQGSYM
jgi:hypothetical protein